MQVGLKELRQNMDKYAQKIKQGNSFVVFRKSEPLFRIEPLDEQWEEVVDFTKVKKGGIQIDELLTRL